MSEGFRRNTKEKVTVLVPVSDENIVNTDIVMSESQVDESLSLQNSN